MDTPTRSPAHPDKAVATAAHDTFLAILLVFLRLGLTSFGGPAAHLGYFHAEFVTRRRWLDEAGFADLVAIGQFLPGPASSQVGFALGVLRGGLSGGAAAWLGFTMPSAIAMLLAAYGADALTGGTGAAVVHGLKLVAVAVVAQAVWGMAGGLCPDRQRATLAIFAAVALLLLPSAFTQLCVLLAGAGAGLALYRAVPATGPDAVLPVRVPRPLAVLALALFLALLLGLPLLARATGSHAMALVDVFYHAGSLVFGGGHVVLPLLERAMVPTGWITADGFLAGYGVAQAMPGPLFTVAAFLWAARSAWPNGLLGGTLALAALFLPGMLLMYGMLPFWASLRRRPAARAAMMGVNAAVVGVLLAALFDPIWTSTVRSPADFAVALLAFTALVPWKMPVLPVVVATACAGAVSSQLAGG